MFGAEEPVYKGSGWTAVRDLVAREPEEDNDHWIEQTAVIYPQAKECQPVLREVEVDLAEVRRLVTRGGHLGYQLAVGVRRRHRPTDGLIAQMARQEDADGWGCQHALAAVSNLTVETWACAYSPADEATTMAIDIINNAAEK